MEKHNNRILIETEVKAILKKVHEMDMMGYTNYYHNFSKELCRTIDAARAADNTGTEPVRLQETIVLILMKIGYMVKNNRSETEIEISWIPSGYELT